MLAILSLSLTILTGTLSAWLVSLTIVQDLFLDFGGALLLSAGIISLLVVSFRLVQLWRTRHERAVLPTTRLFRLDESHTNFIEQSGASEEKGSEVRIADLFSCSEFAALFSQSGAEVSPRLRDLAEFGTRFSIVTSLADGRPVLVKGRPVGLTAEVQILHSDADTHEVFDLALRARALSDQLDRAEQRLNNVPVPLAEISARGEMVWANAGFRALTGSSDVSEEALDLITEPPKEPVLWPDSTAPEPNFWARTYIEESPEETKYLALLPASAEVESRETLRDLMNTLADTFAHLSAGVAVFGPRQTLSIFNPALVRLFEFDAVALAAQPTLRAFLDALRQSRRLPEMRDYSAWREAFLTLGQPGRTDAYQEDWTLPSGQVIGVTARYHKGGGIVFVFEDNSNLTMLERRYRQEIETSQTTLDSLQDGVAVFDTAGSLIFANTAFERMWDMPPMSTLEAPTIREITARMAEKSRSTGVWETLRSFVLSADTRTSWTTRIAMREGQPLEGRFSLLPDGSAMAIFRHLPMNELDHAPDGDEAIKALEEAPGSAPGTAPAEAFLADCEDLDPKALATGRLPLGTPHASGLAPQSSADATLLTLLAAIQAPDAGSPRRSSFAHVCTMLAGLGLRVEHSEWPSELKKSDPHPALRRVLWALGLVSAWIAAPGSRVQLAGRVGTRAERPQLRFGCTVYMRQGLDLEQDPPSGIGLLKRLLKSTGADFQMHVKAGSDRVHFAGRVALGAGDLEDESPKEIQVVT